MAVVQCAKLLVLLLACTLWHDAAAQLSKAVAADEKDDGNKFLNRKADLDADPFQTIEHDENRSSCQYNIDLKWMTEVSSSVYATPLITDLFSDGRKDIVVPSFVHYLEVLEGGDGSKALGWPAFHKSTMHASPLLYDIDFDGVRDIMLATYDGEILFVKDTGELMPERITVNRLRVRKDWYVGLNPDPQDHSHPDVGNGDDKQDLQVGDRAKAKGGVALEQQPPRPAKDKDTPKDKDKDSKLPPLVPVPFDENVNKGLQDRVIKFVVQIREYEHTYGKQAASKLLAEAQTANQRFYDLVMHVLAKQPPVDQPQPQGKQDSGSSSGSGSANGGRRRLMAAGDSGSDSGGMQGVEIDKQHMISEEAADSFKVFEEDEGFEYPRRDAPLSQEEAAALALADQDQDQDTADHDGAGELDGDADAGGAEEEDGDEAYTAIDALFSKFEYDEFGDRVKVQEGGDDDEDIKADDAKDPEHLFARDHYDHLYAGDYQDVKTDLSRWQDEDFVQWGHRAFGGTHVEVDPHILCTPAIADIDNDGHDELVIAASYFFDREYYDDAEHAKDVKGLDITKYVAAAIAVYDLRTRQEKWVQHLDLSTDSTTFKAYAYSAPTLVDLDGDGFMEIVVGGSLGFLYVLDHKGDPRPGWPIQMAEIQGQALVADINNDGKLEVFASDTRGNVAAFNIDGTELWERHVRSLVAHAAVAADINGDGELEVVFGTGSGHIYALRGSNGLDAEHFPFRTHGRIQSSPLVTQLLPRKRKPSGSDAAKPPPPPAVTGLQVVMASFDGFLYAVDGISGCADTVDIGETSYSTVLADDLDGDGSMELLLATMNGNVYSFGTRAPFHPLRTWTSQVLGPNGQVSRYNYAGVFATTSSRRPRDVAGQKLQVKVVVQDSRSVFSPNGSLVPAHLGPYNLSVVLKGVGVSEMNAGESPVIGVSDTVPGPGTYMLEVPCPRTRTTATIYIEMVDKQGMIFTDEFSLSFHMTFHRLLKWFVALPLAGMALALLAMTGPAAEGTALPTYYNSHRA